MPKELMTMVLERDNLQQKWGLTIQGGADLALTAKIASVKVRLHDSLQSIWWERNELLGNKVKNPLVEKKKKKTFLDHC